MQEIRDSLCFVDADGPPSVGSRGGYYFALITDLERLSSLIGSYPVWEASCVVFPLL